MKPCPESGRKGNTGCSPRPQHPGENWVWSHAAVYTDAWSSRPWLIEFGRRSSRWKGCWGLRLMWLCPHCSKWLPLSLLNLLQDKGFCFLFQEASPTRSLGVAVHPDGSIMDLCKVKVSLLLYFANRSLQWILYDNLLNRWERLGMCSHTSYVPDWISPRFRLIPNLRMHNHPQNYRRSRVSLRHRHREATNAHWNGRLTINLNFYHLSTKFLVENLRGPLLQPDVRAVQVTILIHAAHSVRDITHSHIQHIQHIWHM